MRLEREVSVDGVVGLRDHVEVALVFQYSPVALPHDRMVVDQQDRNALGLGSCHPGTIAFSSKENASTKRVKRRAV